MTQRQTRVHSTDYEALRETSGWYLAAWRAFRGLSQEELAAELGHTKGRISDLERGAGKTRFNRDHLVAAARALKVSQGHLLDVNPFAADPRLEQMTSIYRDLDERDREELVRLADVLSRRKA